LIATASHYRQSHNSVPASWRIDFIAIELDRAGKLKRLELIENAVGED
jgi:Holliday junction resolvase-like predicted endonuclease